MQTGVSERQARLRHRHELRTLTYATLDEANGGVVRNLSSRGIAVHAVTAVRPRQQLRVRFELRYPRLRIETRGEVVWSTFSGLCGIRFLDLPARAARQIDEWIFGHLLEAISLHITAPQPALNAATAPVKQLQTGNANAATQPARSIADAIPQQRDNDIGTPATKTDEVQEPSEVDDGLMVSPAPIKVIEIPPPAVPTASTRAEEIAETSRPIDLDWLSRPLSGRSLALAVDALVVLAALALFALVFLVVARDAPRHPFAVAAGAAAVLGALYWGFFQVFGGSSLGTRLAQIVANSLEEEPETARFR